MVFIMKNCKHCDVIILDDSKTCPLCKGVLVEPEDTLEATANGYPSVAFSADRFHLVNRIMLFISVIIIVASIAINYLFYDDLYWSLISIVVVLYSWTIVRHAIINSIHLANKIMVQSLSGAVIVACIDLVIGYRGWSVDYVIPQIAIAANLGIFILLIISKLDWKRYVLQQMGMAFFGLIPMILLLVGIVDHPLMTYVATGISVVILLFTVILGDKSVKNEMIRRFHV